MTAPTRSVSVRSSLMAALLEAAVVGGMFACLEAWIVPLLQGRLGAAAAIIGALAMLPQLISILVGPVSGRLIRWLGGPRHVAIHHGWVQVMGFGLLQIPLYLASDGHPPGWAVAFAVTVVALMNGVGAALGGPAWMAYFGGLVPHRVMGRYTSHRNRIFHISRLAFAGLFMVVMSTFPITESITGMQIVLAAAMCSRFGSVLLQFRQIEPKIRPALPSSRSQILMNQSGGFLHFLTHLTSTPFGRFTLVWSLFQAGMMVAAPYYATYLVAKHSAGGLDLGGQAVLYSVLIYTNTITRLLCLPSAGALVDRCGSQVVFKRAILILTVIPLGWAAAAAFDVAWPILVIEVLSGFGWALADASVGPQLFRCHTDPQQRAHLISWHSTVFNACCLAGTGLGMLLLAFPMSGVSPYLVLFLTTLVLRFPAVILAQRLLPAQEPESERTTALWRLIPGVDASLTFGRSLIGRFLPDDRE